MKNLRVIACLMIDRRDVVFNEERFSEKTNVDEANVQKKEQMKIEPILVDDNEVDEENNEVGEERRYPDRQRGPPVRYGLDEYAEVHHVAYHLSEIVEPKCIQEALEDDHAIHWKEVMDLEYRSLMENDTWELVELPNERKPIQNKWVFKAKYQKDGKVDCFKARLVAKGYAQKPGFDYIETFSRQPEGYVVPGKEIVWLQRLFKFVFLGEKLGLYNLSN